MSEDETDNPPGRDQAIGKNVMRLRGARSQQSVADEMQRRGHKWSQATVWSVEQGKRPLRLAEAESLVEILGTKIEDLLRVSRRSINLLRRDMSVARGSLLDAAVTYEKVAYKLATLADGFAVAGDPVDIEIPDPPETVLRLNLPLVPSPWGADPRDGLYVRRFVIDRDFRNDDGEHQAEG